MFANLILSAATLMSSAFADQPVTCQEMAVRAANGVRRASESQVVKNAKDVKQVTPYLTEKGRRAFQVGFGYEGKVEVSYFYDVEIVFDSGKCDVHSVTKEINGVG